MHFEYARAKLDRNNYALNAGMESRRETIDRKAAESALYMGCFPVTHGPTGATVEFDLIFEVE